MNASTIDSYIQNHPAVLLMALAGGLWFFVLSAKAFVRQSR